MNKIRKIILGGLVSICCGFGLVGGIAGITVVAQASNGAFKGDKGDVGEKGDKGDAGKDGKDGHNGRDGATIIIEPKEQWASMDQIKVWDFDPWLLGYGERIDPKQDRIIANRIVGKKVELLATMNTKLPFREALSTSDDYLVYHCLPLFYIITIDLNTAATNSVALSEVWKQVADSGYIQSYKQKYSLSYLQRRGLFHDGFSEDYPFFDYDYAKRYHPNFPRFFNHYFINDLKE